MKKIIIIDDELDMAQTMAILLREEGYDSSAYDDGGIALKIMKEDPPGLVILDVMMPLVRGLDVLKSMKEDPQLRSIPILLISASKEPEVEGEKWNHFLRKPFDIYKLIKEVETLAI